jgi:hypothetical protein
MPLFFDGQEGKANFFCGNKGLDELLQIKIKDKINYNKADGS